MSESIPNATPAPEPGGAQPQPSGSSGAAEARAELDRLERDPEHLRQITNRDDPSHDAAIRRRGELAEASLGDGEEDTGPGFRPAASVEELDEVFDQGNPVYSSVRAELERMAPTERAIALRIVNTYGAAAAAQLRDLESPARAEEATRQAEAKLKAEWGASYQSNVGAAKLALDLATGGDARVGDELAHLELRDGTPLGNHPAMLRALARLGSMIRTSGSRFADPFGGNYSTPGKSGSKEPPPAVTLPAVSEVESEIARLEADSAFMDAYTTREHPLHGDAVRRMTGLFEARSAAQRLRG